MHDSVKKAFTAFQTKFEGAVPWMYLDVKGLVTTGIGNLIDSVEAAQALPWQRPDGSPASASEIADAWNTVKSHQEMAKLGGGAFKNLTGIRLSQKGIDTLITNVASSFDKTLAKRWPGYMNWPADAQLALLGIAWAYGPNFSFTGMNDALAGKILPDFKKASTIADAAFTREIQRGNPGIKSRQAAVKVAFNNAHAVMKGHGKVGTLHYPKSVSWVRVAGGGLVTLAALGGIGYYGYYRYSHGEKVIPMPKKLPEKWYLWPIVRS